MYDWETGCTVFLFFSLLFRGRDAHIYGEGSFYREILLA